MYNGWTNWETWITVLWLDELGNMEADDIEQLVVELFEVVPESGLVRDLIEGSLREINFDEIAKSFAAEEHEGGDEDIEPCDSGYECDTCGEPASFYNGDQDEFSCEECN